MATSSAWRPPQWASGPSVSTVLLKFPGLPNAVQYSPSGIGATLPTAPTTYVFDVVIRVGHEQQVRKTEHPVQTGANISDHAYAMPARVVLDVGMSDAMDSFTLGQWAGSRTKSVSAYQIMLAMQYARVPLVLVTKLRTYSNMIITSISPEETVKTIAGLRMRVDLEEIFAASIETVQDSARPDATESSSQGTVVATPVSATQQAQNGVTAGMGPAPVNSPGAGAYSSCNNKNLDELHGR
jgi:hypothetical protein